MDSFYKYWFPVILYSILIFIISSIPGSALPRNIASVNYILHILEYFPLGILTYRAVKNTKLTLPVKKIFIFSVLLVVVYAASDEFHQLFVPGRYASSLDLFCDSLGAIIGARIVT